ncbi:MAG: queuosine precursor transporter [Rickettsiales bacterium]|nr:queuosine precursor transporter [Rickettsiales bacterium]
MIRKDSVYLFLTGIFFSLLVISAIILNSSFINFSNSSIEANLAFIIPTGVLLYSITYLIIDIIAEFFGKSKTINAVLVGFIISILVFFGLAIENNLTNSDSNLINQLYTNNCEIIFAFAISFLICQILNVNLYHLLMKKTRGRHIWLRNNVSTIVSQIADTIIFVFLLYVFGNLNNDFNSSEAVISLIINTSIVKILIAIIDTPILYAAIYILKKKMKKFEPNRFNSKRNHRNKKRPYNNSRKSFNRNNESIQIVD